MKLTGTVIIFGAAALLVLIAVIIILRKHKPRKLNQEKFEQKWQQLQAMCASRATWPDALISADLLLDEVLKKRKFKGKSMGERMVAAQRLFSDNDSLWFAHKLRKQLQESPEKINLKQADVQDALIGIRQALKDLGAMQ